VDAPDRIEHIVTTGILQEIATRASADPLVDVLFRLVCRQDDKASRQIRAPDLGDYTDAVEHWHAKVDQGDIGPVSSPQLDGLEAVIRFRDDGHVGLASDHRPESLEDNRMIVGEEDANRLAS
jgi:hypothetical protein